MGLTTPRNSESLSRLTVVLSVTLIVLLFFSFLNSLFRNFQIDEFEAIHTAWYLSVGQKIYIDFFQHHHPFFYFSLVPIILLFGENHYALIFARIFVFCWGLLIVYITWLLMIELKIKKIVAQCGLVFLLVSVTFSMHFIEMRPDVPQTALGMSAILFYLRWWTRRSSPWMILSGAAWGLSFLFLQKAVFLGLGFGLIMAIDILRGKIHVSPILGWIAGAGSILTPFFLYWIISGQWSEYYFFNWKLNMLFPIQEAGIEKTIGAIKLNFFQYSFFVCGIIVCLKDKLNWRIAVITLINLFCFFYFLRVQWPHNFLPVLPLVAIISAIGMYYVFEHLPKIKSPSVLMVLAIVILIGIRAYSLYPPFSVMQEKILNFSQIAKIQYILSMTSHEDYIYDGCPQFNLFRKDVDFLWFSLSNDFGALPVCQECLKYNYDVLKQIKKYKPKIVGSFYLNYNSKKAILKMGYSPSEHYPDLVVRKKSAEFQ